MILTCKALGTGLVGGTSFVAASLVTDELGNVGKYVREGGSLAIIAASIAFVLWKLVPMVMTVRQQESARFAETMEKLATTHADAIKSSRTDFQEAVRELSHANAEREKRMLESLDRNSESVRHLADNLRR